MYRSFLCEIWGIPYPLTVESFSSQNCHFQQICASFLPRKFAALGWRVSSICMYCTCVHAYNHLLKCILVHSIHLVVLCLFFYSIRGWSSASQTNLRPSFGPSYIFSLQFRVTGSPSLSPGHTKSSSQGFSQIPVIECRAQHISAYSWQYWVSWLMKVINILHAPTCTNW